MLGSCSICCRLWRLGCTVYSGPERQITLDKRESGFHTEEHARLAQAFAGQAAIAIENARMFSELKQRDRELQELNEQLEQRVKDRTYELQNANTALEQSLSSLREA